MERIRSGLDEAREALAEFTPGEIASRKKSGRGDPVTEADVKVDGVLKAALPGPGDGWLSEETVDDPSRLGAARAWIVDPLDGTREFVQGIPEWCVSIALVESGVPVAGGILSPSTDRLFLGGQGAGLALNGEPARPTERRTLDGARVLASRSEVGRGEWERFEDAPFETVPCGSVAYKLALVAAGLADATWTLVPKHEWDVAGGAALVKAAGGEVRTLDWQEPVFNRKNPKLTGFVAAGAGLIDEIGEFLKLGPWAER